MIVFHRVVSEDEEQGSGCDGSHYRLELVLEQEVEILTLDFWIFFESLVPLIFVAGQKAIFEYEASEPQEPKH